MRRFQVGDMKFEKVISSLTRSDNNLEDAFARAVLSFVTEPGDQFAGFLVKHLSASALLEFEIGKRPFEEMQSRLLEAAALDEAVHRFKDLGETFLEARQRWSARLNLTDFSKSLNLAQRVSAQLLLPSHETWPTNVNDLEWATPHCLWVRSRADLRQLNQPAIAIVGSRVASNYGQWVTSEIVSDCVTRGLVIVSGGAYGIDAVAHRTAIAQACFNVAFMAGGVDRLYPSGNTQMFEQLIRVGAIIAEQAPGASPTKWRFLQRNRLIAALSSATVIVEAGSRSGALNTVSHAQHLDRAIAAVPGPITSQVSRGCNRLIADAQAQLLSDPSEAANLVLGQSGWFQAELDSLGSLETRALDAMTSKAQSADRIAALAGLSAREVAIALGQLKLLGFVKEVDNGWVKLALESEQRSEVSRE